MSTLKKLKLPSLFNSIEFRKSLGETKALFHNMLSKPEKFKIESLGPFIFFTKLKASEPSYIIFSLNYTICQRKNNHETIELQYNTDPNQKCVLTFKTKEKAMIFSKEFQDIFKDVGLFVSNTNYSIFEQKSECVECLFPGGNKVVKSVATINNIANKLKIQILRTDNSKLGFETVLIPKSFVQISPLMENVKVFGKNYHTCTFSIKSKSSPEIVMVKCSDIQSLIDWVILIFAYSNRTLVTNDSKPSISKKLTEHKKSVNLNNEKDSVNNKSNENSNDNKRTNNINKSNENSNNNKHTNNINKSNENSNNNKHTNNINKSNENSNDNKHTNNINKSNENNTDKVKEQIQIPTLLSRENYQKRKFLSVEIPQKRGNIIFDDKEEKTIKEEQQVDDLIIEDIQIENIIFEEIKEKEIKQETEKTQESNQTKASNQNTRQTIEKKTAVLLQSNQGKHSNYTDHSNEIEPFEIPEVNNFEQQIEEYKNSIFEINEAPNIPSFEKLSTIAKASLNTLFTQENDFALSSILNDLQDDNEMLKVFSNETKSFSEIIDETITNIETEFKFDFENNFDFSINPEFNVKSFLSCSEPDTQYFFNEISNLNTFFISSGNLHKDDNPCVSRFCFLLASLLVNGLINFNDIKSNQSLVPFFEKLTIFIPELSQLIKLIENETLTINQASISTCFMIKNNLFDRFILQTHELERKTDFLMNYYNNFALIRNSTFIETLSFMIRPIFENNSFIISFKSNIIQSQNDEDIKRFILTPGFEYLEIEQIFQKDSNIVKIISDQFNNGLKPKGILKTMDAWQMITDISSTQYKNEYWDEFIEFVQSTKSYNIMKFSQKKLEILIEEGMKRRKMHIWLLLLIINENKINEYYYKESSLSDHYRIRYIIQNIAKYFEENKAN